MSTTTSPTESIRAELARCKGDLGRFSRTVIGRGRLWSRQREICRSVDTHPVTLVPTGNAIGKSFVDAEVLHAFLMTHPGSLVIATAPTQIQLEEVLWKEVERAYHGSRIPLGGRLLKSPLKVDYGGGWQALAYSTNKVERFSGHHGQDVLAITDEASGVEDAIKEAIDSLNPSRFLATGNPLRPDGWFYEACARADSNPLANLIQVSSLESPHIDLPRSPWGLADATWLEKARNDYGEGSLWWTCHVLGLFPDSGVDTLIPRSWIDAAARAVHVRSGPCRTSIDLAGGTGRDRTVILTRDDNGVLACDLSHRWSLETAAEKAAVQVRQWGVDARRVVYDCGGLGADFANRLKAVGIQGAQPYQGGSGGGRSYGNFRTASAWAMRQRLDPLRTTTTAGGIVVPQVPFSIRPEWVALVRDELQGLRYLHAKDGSVELEPKEKMIKRLHKSPDIADALIESFAFPG